MSQFAELVNEFGKVPHSGNQSAAQVVLHSNRHMEAVPKDIGARGRELEWFGQGASIAKVLPCHITSTGFAEVCHM